MLSRQVCLPLRNAMREFVGVSSGFRGVKITPFRLGMEICVRSTEPRPASSM